MPSKYKTILHKAVSLGASAVLISTAFPVFAFAEDGKNITDEGKSIILAESTDGTPKGIKWPDGKWVETEQERSQGIYKWSTYVRGDNSHYGHYDVTLTFEVSDNELKHIDLSSSGTTFGGRWGVLTPHDGASSVIGSLPEKISDVTTVDKEAKTVLHKLENAQVYGGLTYTNITLLKNDGTTKIGTLTYSAGGRGGSAGWKSAPAEGASPNFASFDDATGTLTVNDDDAAVVCISEKIGDYYVFSQYYGLNDEGEKLAEAITNENKTDFNKEVSGIGAKDRDVYTAAAYNLIIRQQLASFLAYEGDGDTENLEDIDTVSAATKSSQSIIEGIYAAAGYWYPYSNNDEISGATGADWDAIFNRVADDVVVTIDGKELPADTTLVREQDDGAKVMKNALFGDDVAIAGFDLYALGSDLSAAQEWKLSKTPNADRGKKALASYTTNYISATGHGIVGGYGILTKQGGRVKDEAGNVVPDVLDDEMMSYNPETKELTIKDDRVDYVVIQYAVGKFSDAAGGVCGVTYKLSDITDKAVYALMNVPYDMFFDSYGVNGASHENTVDSISSATTNKIAKVAHAYAHNDNAAHGGADIDGIKVPVRLYESEYKALRQSITDEHADMYVAENLLDAQPSVYFDAYDVLATGKLGKVHISEPAKKEVDVEALLSSDTKYGEYLLDFTFNNKDTEQADASRIYAGYLETTDGAHYAMTHLANFWSQSLINEVSWNTTDAYIGNGETLMYPAHYADMPGKTLKRLVMLTEDGEVVYNFSNSHELVVPAQYETDTYKGFVSSDGISASDGKFISPIQGTLKGGVVELSGVPEDLGTLHGAMIYESSKDNNNPSWQKPVKRSTLTGKNTYASIEDGKVQLAEDAAFNQDVDTYWIALPNEKFATVYGTMQNPYKDLIEVGAGDTIETTIGKKAFNLEAKVNQPDATITYRVAGVGKGASSTITVDEKGNVTSQAVGKNKVTVTATLKDGNKVYTTVSVDVKEKENAIWKRLQGAKALDTMKSITTEGWTNEDAGGTVVIATINSYHDGIAAAGLAGLDNAPILMTNAKTLSDQTKDELKRLAPKKIYIAGGTSVISAKVANDIKSLTGVNPIRCAGAKAADTSAELANKGKGRWSDTAVIATTKSYHDALAVAPLAYAKDMPILLATNGTSLNSSVLSSLKYNNIKKVIIVGGNAAISTNVENTLKKNGLTIEVRLQGKTAIQTSRAIAEYGINKLGLSADNMSVATSKGFYDALCGAPFVGKNNSVLVLADDSNNENSSFAGANKYEILHGYVFGGSAAIGDKTFKAFDNATKL